MAKIKHIVIASQDPDRTAQFFIEVFGLTELMTVDGPDVSGRYVTDGNINLGILNFKTDEAAGGEGGAGFSGLHHIGIQVDDLAETAKRLDSTEVRPTETVYAKAPKKSGPLQRDDRLQYTGPDTVVIDVNETGWHGTSG